MFSDAFIILTSVNSVAVKVVFSSHVGSTSSGQHFVTSQRNYCRKLTRAKQVLRHIFIASVNHVTVVRHNM